MKKDVDELSNAEAVKRSEAALKRMLSTPPTRHNHSKVSRKPKAKKKAKPEQ